MGASTPLLVLAALAAARPAACQEGLLERWTTGYLAEGWAPRWSTLEGGERLRGEGAPRVSVDIGTDVLHLRSALEQSASVATVSVRQPLSRAFTLRATAASGSWSTSAEGRTLLRTPRSEAVAGGLEVAQELGVVGRLRLVALAGWDGGGGGEGRLDVGNRRYGLSVAGWRAHARGSVVPLPADSLGDVGLGQLASGIRLSGSLSLPAGGLTWSPRASWKSESFDARSGAPQAFFLTYPTGDATTWDVGLAVSGAMWDGSATYESRELSLESTLLRLEQSAGRLFFLNQDFDTWSGEVGRRAEGVRWSVRLARESTDGDLSARLETWPFLGVWGQLTTIAYRLRGRLRGTSTWGEVRRERVDGAGWGWSLGLGRTAVLADRDSWFVTSLGFSRTQWTMTALGADPAVLIGGDLKRVFGVGLGTAEARLEGGLPVYAKEIVGGGAGAASSEGGLAGYFGVTLAWRW